MDTLTVYDTPPLYRPGDVEVGDLVAEVLDVPALPGEPTLAQQLWTTYRCRDLPVETEPCGHPTGNGIWTLGQVKVLRARECKNAPKIQLCEPSTQRQIDETAAEIDRQFIENLVRQKATLEGRLADDREGMSEIWDCDMKLDPGTCFVHMETAVQEMYAECVRQNQSRLERRLCVTQ